MNKIPGFVSTKQAKHALELLHVSILTSTGAGAGGRPPEITTSSSDRDNHAVTLAICRALPVRQHRTGLFSSARDRAVFKGTALAQCALACCGSGAINAHSHSRAHRASAYTELCPRRDGTGQGPKGVDAIRFVQRVGAGCDAVELAWLAPLPKGRNLAFKNM